MKKIGSFKVAWISQKGYVLPMDSLFETVREMCIEELKEFDNKEIIERTVLHIEDAGPEADVYVFMKE